MGLPKGSDRLAWEDDFIAGLRAYGSVHRAAHGAGRTAGAAYGRRQASARFRQAWEQALADFRKAHGKAIRNSAARPAPRQWKRAFLEALVETSNVTASAQQAHVSPREVYRARRTDEAFAAEWRSALFEGYANLEMEVLCFLRDPAPDRKMDVAAALRLLAAHKDTIAAERATRANVSAAEVRASIARKVDALREQLLAEREKKRSAGDA